MNFMFHEVSRETILVKWKAQILFCGKFIQDIIQQILSELCKFYERYNKNDQSVSQSINLYFRHMVHREDTQKIFTTDIRI